MKASTIEKARQIEKNYGTSYYLATLFLPKPMREAVFVLYAFVRIPDEIVDNPKSGSNPAELLQIWKRDWTSTYNSGHSSSNIMLATKEIFQTYHIPFSVSLEFIDAMILDITKARYTTYKELQSYMRGSANVVGIMLTYVFGYRDEQAFEYGEKLGEAMQLTNFLRDVREDYDKRGRIYLPLDELASFNVTEDMIAHHAPTPEFIALMKYQVKRARALYLDSAQGIPLLSPPSRRAVTLAARFYEAILDEIEASHYDVFSKRARVPFIKKLLMISRSYVGQ